MKPGAVQLAHAERAFRTLRSRDTRVRPIRQHVEDRVRAHIFLCMLAYYVRWHLEQAWKPLLFRGEQPPEHEDPVAPAQRSDMGPLLWTRFVRIEPFRQGDGPAEGVRRRVAAGPGERRFELRGAQDRRQWRGPRPTQRAGRRFGDGPNQHRDPGEDGIGALDSD